MLMNSPPRTPQAHIALVRCVRVRRRLSVDNFVAALLSDNTNAHQLFSPLFRISRHVINNAAAKLLIGKSPVHARVAAADAYVR